MGVWEYGVMMPLPHSFTNRMDAFLNSLGLTLLYLALLGIGIIYAVIILIGGALHHVHLPGLGFDIGRAWHGRRDAGWPWPSSRTSPSVISSSRRRGRRK